MASTRKQYTGSVISSGIVLGHTRVISAGELQIDEISIPASKTNQEFSQLGRAVKETAAELTELRDSADKKIGGPIAKIFDAQLMIAEDSEFLKKVKAEILSQRKNAAFVYNALIAESVKPLSGSDDAYLKQMASDIEAVATRVLSHLTGTDKCDLRFSPNTIVVGRTFSPGDIVSYRQRKAVGFVVSEGGRNSHMALIARSLMLPVILLPNDGPDIPNNARIILDGTTGDVIVEPDESEWSEHQKKKRRFGPGSLTKIKRLVSFPPSTRDGQKIELAANLSLAGPADDILAEKNVPVGLYRTEFLYLSYGGFPDEEAQFDYYQQVAQKFDRSEVVLRTFDLGYDKLSTHNVWPDEDNPALGWRGIRPMLEMGEIFKSQIRAILRASSRKNLKILLPMISDMGELILAYKLINQAKSELKKNKIGFDEEIQIGIMVEVPAAALMADRLAAEVDFISIGTNDLTQYTLAADRLNQKVAGLYNPFHPSVIQLVSRTVTACKKHGIPVSICGEIAGESLAVPLFVGMGVDSLSVNPNRLVDIYRLIGRINSVRAQELAESLVAAASIKEVMDKLSTFGLTIGKNL